MLIAVGVDTNNGIYPVAYGIMESENQYSWTWFLTCLADDFDLYTNSNFTFITDRQKVLVPTIAKLFPAAEHRFCVRHINENMNITWKGGDYKEMSWKCATSTTVVRYIQIDIDHASGGNLRVLSAEEAWKTIEDCAKYDKQWKNPTNTIPDQTIANLKTQLVENEVVDNLSPQSTLQVLSSFEVYTPLVTHLEEVEETTGILMEVEPLNETKLEEVGLNCNHNTPLSSREDLSFDKPEPQLQPSPNCPPLDASLGTERGFKPPIKPQSPDSFRMKVLDILTINTPPSSLVAYFYLRDLYCYYHPCVDDPKKHYGFKPGLLGHSGSLGVDFSKLGMIGDDWKLESKEVSLLEK
ncbi:ribonuclease H-like domain-containing protein [Tanacetum coccineum]